MDEVLYAKRVFRIAGMADRRIEFLVKLLDDPASDIENALEVLALTDDVARQALGQIRVIPDADTYRGPYASLIMLPFLRPNRGRFNDKTFGAWYAADSETTAYSEKRFHLIRWLSSSSAPKFDLAQRVLSAMLSEPLLSPRRGQVADEVYNPHPDRYDASNALAREARKANANGLLYDSVRRNGYICVAVFRPCIIADVTIEAELRLEWDGSDLSGFKAILS